jgi:hypothetical protein
MGARAVMTAWVATGSVVEAIAAAPSCGWLATGRLVYCSFGLLIQIW